MDKETVTLVASGLALIASFVTLFVNIRYQRAAEFRAIHRKALEPYLVSLSNASYEILAITSKYLRAKSKESQDKYNEQAKATSIELDRIRRETRYILYGLDEPLRMLAKEPLFFNHFLDNSEKVSAALTSATKLREEVDKIVISSYRNGRPPTDKEIRRVSVIVREVRNHVANNDC